VRNPSKGPGARLTNGLQCQRNDGVGRAAPPKAFTPARRPTGTWRLTGYPAVLRVLDQLRSLMLADAEESE
jgi:hypothetical protein